MNLQDIVTKAAPVTAAAVTALTPVARGQDSIEVVRSRMLLENAQAVAFKDDETAGPIVIVGSGDIYNAKTLGFIGTEPWAINRTGLEIGPVDSFSVNTEYDEFIQRFTAIVYKTQGPIFYGLRDFMSTAESVGGLFGPTDTHLLVFGMDAPNEKEKAALIHVDDDNFQRSTVEFFDAPKLYTGLVGTGQLTDSNDYPFDVFMLNGSFWNTDTDSPKMDTLVLDPMNLDLRNVVGTAFFDREINIPVGGLTRVDGNIWGVTDISLGRGLEVVGYDRVSVVDAYEKQTTPTCVVSYDGNKVVMGGLATNNSFKLGMKLENPDTKSDFYRGPGADTIDGEGWELVGSRITNESESHQIATGLSEGHALAMTRVNGELYSLASGKDRDGRAVMAVNELDGPHFGFVPLPGEALGMDVLEQYGTVARVGLGFGDEVRVYDLDFNNMSLWERILDGEPIQTTGFKTGITGLDFLKMPVNDSLTDNKYLVHAATVDGITRGVMHTPQIPILTEYDLLAGQRNLVKVEHATPGSTVYLAASDNLGLSLFKKCPGTTVQLDHPILLGSGYANSAGEAYVETKYIPDGVFGKEVYLQAISDCVVSGLFSDLVD